MQPMTEDQERLVRLEQSNHRLRQVVRFLIDSEASSLAVEFAEDVLAGRWPIKN